MAESEKTLKLAVGANHLDLIEKYLRRIKKVDIVNFSKMSLSGMTDGDSLKGKTAAFYNRLWSYQETYLDPKNTAFEQAQGFLNIWGFITQELLGQNWYLHILRDLETANLLTGALNPALLPPIDVALKPGIYEIGGEKPGIKFLREADQPPAPVKIDILKYSNLSFQAAGPARELVKPGLYKVNDEGVFRQVEEQPPAPAPAPEDLKPEIWESTADIWIDVSCYLCKRYEQLQVSGISDFILNLQAGPGFKKWQTVQLAGGRSVLVCGKCPGSKKMIEKEPFTDEEDS